MREIVIIFRGKDEEKVAAAIASSVEKIIKKADVETGFLSKRSQNVQEVTEEQSVQEVKQIQIPAFMIDRQHMKRNAKRLAKRRTRYGKKVV